MSRPTYEEDYHDDQHVGRPQLPLRLGFATKYALCEDTGGLLQRRREKGGMSCADLWQKQIR